MDSRVLRFTVLVLRWKKKVKGRWRTDRFRVMCSFMCVCEYVCVTDGDEHAQLALASILGIDVELYGEAGGNTVGQPGAAGSHLTGIMSWLNPKLEGTKKTQMPLVPSLIHEDNKYCDSNLILELLCTCGGCPPLHT